MAQFLIFQELCHSIVPDDHSDLWQKTLLRNVMKTFQDLVRLVGQFGCTVTAFGEVVILPPEGKTFRGGVRNYALLLADEMVVEDLDAMVASLTETQLETLQVLLESAA